MSSVFGICFQVFYFVVPFILLSFFFILLFHVTFFPSSLTIGFILAYCALSKLVGRRRNSIRPDWCGNIHWGSAFWLPSPLAARTPLFFQFSFSIVFCCVFCFFFGRSSQGFSEIFTDFRSFLRGNRAILFCGGSYRIFVRILGGGQFRGCRIVLW